MPVTMEEYRRSLKEPALAEQLREIRGAHIGSAPIERTDRLARHFDVRRRPDRVP